VQKQQQGQLPHVAWDEERLDSPIFPRLPKRQQYSHIHAFYCVGRLA
jgi:imidazoleglycerol phosphate synthase glutamine amidotransferase subunit HisH